MSSVRRSTFALAKNTAHTHTLFDKLATEETLMKVLDASGGGSGISNINIVGSIPLEVNVVDVSALSLQSTQADILLMAETQDLSGVKINPDHPPFTTYDFDNNHVVMTMKGPTTPDTRWSIDTTNGRDGWRFINTVDADGSNCYFYANGTGTGNQVNLLYENFTSFYYIVTMDRCDSVNDAPFFVCYSSPTGSGDCMPFFAHSKWQFVLPSGSQLFQGEKVVLYYNPFGLAIPAVHSNLRHLPLVLTSIGNNGERLGSELIYLMTINTQSARPLGNVNYILHNAGYNVLYVPREVEFSNSLERKKLANLSSTNIPVAVSNFPLPLSSVGINNFPASQPVSGTFWQATQPVSGTFWQPTQPVSIVDAVAVSNDSLTDMSFYDTGTYGKLLKVLLPELTNVHIMATEENIPVSNGQLDKFSFTDMSTISVLNTKTMYDTATNTYGTTDIDGSDNLPIIDMRNYTKVSIFGYTEYSTGMNPIVIQYSIDGVTFFNSSNTIWTSSGQPFSWDNSSLAVPYIRLHLQVTYTIFQCNVCRK